MMSQSLVSQLLNIEWILPLIMINNLLHLIPVLERQCPQVNNIFQHTLAPVVLSHQLNEFLRQYLQVVRCLVPHQAIPEEIQEQLLPLPDGQTGLTQDGQKQEGPAQ